MRLCLVEDAAAVDLEPLTLTRPTFDLILGASTLGERAAEAFGLHRCDRPAVVVRPHLAAVVEETGRYAAVNDRGWLGRGPVAVVNPRWLPPRGFAPPPADRPRIGLCGGRPACAWIGPGQAVGLELHGLEAWFEELVSTLPCLELGGEWVERPWDLIARNADYLIRDFEAAGRAGWGGHLQSTITVVGPSDRLLIHDTARVDPYTVFDTTGGPITVAAGAWVQPFTRIEGPSYIGRETQLFRANLRGGVTIGPVCRVGGEVEATIVHGHSNKYHEGFLGHSYVGEWVNLGAITSNSDLRNDYGEVHVPLRGDPVATGMAKVGCFIGDHTRTGLGSMLNTGTAIGVMCNVLPAGLLLPKHVPSFAAVLHGKVGPCSSLEVLLATARIVMGRRGRELTPAHEQLYRNLYERTRLERERAFQKVRDRSADHRPLSSSARL